MRFLKSALALALALAAQPAVAATALDGSAGTTTTGGTTISASLTTTSTNDLIVAVVEAGTSTLGGTPPSYTLSGCSLSWSLRKQTSGLSSTNFTYDQEIWTAPAASALSACAITATASVTQDDAQIAVFGVSGLYSTAAPFDSNGAIPSVVDNPTGSVIANTASYSTSQAHDFIFYVLGTTNYSNNWVTGGSPTPAGTVIYNNGNGGGAHWASLQVAYQIVSSTQSGATFGNNWGGSTNFTLTIDALTADGATPPVAANVFFHPMTGH